MKVGDRVDVKALILPPRWFRARVTEIVDNGIDRPTIYFDYENGSYEGQNGVRWLDRGDVRLVPPLVLLAECADGA